jgi:hypothetical protein
LRPQASAQRSGALIRPKAAEISGKFYRALYDHNFFAARATTASGAPTEKRQQKCSSNARNDDLNVET